jgi:hypothetical protein
MVIQLTPQLQATLAEEAVRLGVTPEALAIATLQERFPPKASSVMPKDEWEARLFGAALPLGFSPPREWMTSENFYD